MKDSRRSVPSIDTNSAPFGEMFLIPAMPSNQRLTIELFSAIPLIRTREQMLAEHPTPSIRIVRMVPFGKVTFAVNPGKCSLAEVCTLAFRVFSGSLIPCMGNVANTNDSTPTDTQVKGRVVIFIEML